MSFENILTEDRRLVILKALEAAAQYRANAYTLRLFCGRIGPAVTMDRLSTDLHWLAEQGMLTLMEAEGVLVATLTQRGMDVASGAAGKVPGVALPQPGN